LQQQLSRQEPQTRCQLSGEDLIISIVLANRSRIVRAQGQGGATACVAQGSPQRLLKLERLVQGERE